ncbi:DNA/RNA helicase, partial [Staphylococcus aureus]
KQQRYTLVFFNHIETMKNAYLRYRSHIPNLICVYSEDVYRFEKVEALRRGEHSIVFTTTILERGFTMARLDVIVINAETFSKAALIQIAGRVGRKIEEPNGLVL